MSIFPDAEAVRALARTLPRNTGVYLYFGGSELPLYIGKSVDLRGRFLAHARAPEDAAMMRQVRRVEYIETAGELGALLLEATLIKQRSPLFNQRLRRNRRLHSLRLAPLGDGALQLCIETVTDAQCGREAGWFGLFRSREAAFSYLRSQAKEHALCQGLLGLEAIGPRGCFGLQIRTCRGACVGQEPRAMHDQRLQEALQAMRVHSWPYPGAIHIVERSGDWVQKHAVHEWRYLHTDCSRRGRLGSDIRQSFDADIYRLLVRPVLGGASEIEQANGAQDPPDTAPARARAKFAGHRDP